MQSATDTPYDAIDMASFHGIEFAAGVWPSRYVEVARTRWHYSQVGMNPAG